MSERIENLQRAVAAMEKCTATHVESVPVRETFQGQVVWEGVVEVFDMIDQPEGIARCYAWTAPSKQGKYDTFVHVLHTPPVKDALTAVRAYIVSHK